VAGSGLDLEMPGPARWMAADHIQGALAAGTIDEELIDGKVRRLLTLLDRTGARHRREPEPERSEEPMSHRELARRVAVESIVLLKNESVLPIADPRRIAVIGELAARTPHQGGGSSAVNPHRVVSILEGIETAAPSGSIADWALGATAHRYPPPFDTSQLTNPETGSGFLAEYFAAPEPGGEPALTVSTDGSRLFFAGEGAADVDMDAFSLRLSGRFAATADGRHVFAAAAAGRLRVSSDDSVVVDHWDEGDPQPEMWEADLKVGDELDLVVEYGSLPNQRERWLGIGCELPASTNPIEEACRLAAESDVAVVVVGLTRDWESEGFDRPDLSLPGEQDRLVRAVIAAQPNTVVVTVAGSAIEMPWLDQAGAVIQVWYGGQEIGSAVADVLFGSADPGGRLPMTFPRNSKQHPGLLNYPGEAGTVRYGEGVYVGYRGFDKLGLEPMFPFGHGLSYTTFELSDVTAEASDERVKVRGRLSNTGDRRGTEVVQVFARDIGGVDRRLAGFAKLRVNAGESVPVEIPISHERLRWWNPAVPGWVATTGEIEFEIRGTFGISAVVATLPVG
jgi:beta-glucosidase